MTKTEMLRLALAGFASAVREDATAPTSATCAGHAVAILARAVDRDGRPFLVVQGDSGPPFGVYPTELEGVTLDA